MYCMFCGKNSHTKDFCQLCPGGICVVCNQSVDSFSSHKCPPRVIISFDTAKVYKEQQYYPSYSERIKEGFKLIDNLDKL